MIRSALMAGLMAVVMTACGVSDMTITDDSVDELTGGMAGDNGRLYNGRLSNGRLANGRLANGRLANGLTVGTIVPTTRDGEFDVWWNADPTGANMEMKYVVRCAAAKGVTVKYKNTAGITYKWDGLLGLAPGWFDKYRTYVDPATLRAEQERVTGCILGLTNSAGVSVQVSAGGMGIPVAASEYTTYPNQEGAFFGNIFIDVPKMYSCKRMTVYGCGTEARSCAFDNGRTCAANPTSCRMAGAGDCASVCSYVNGVIQCTGEGTAYPAFDVRVMGFCGDGYCSPNEVCSAMCNDCGWQASCGPIP